MKYFLILPMELLLHILIVVLCFPQHIEAYCPLIGSNPGFSGPPVVSTISDNVVRISWKDVVTKRECADGFEVKYWKRGFPNSFVMSKYLDAEANFIDLTVFPNTNYIFQAIATVDKGILGIDYNRAPLVEFRMSDNPTTESNVDNTSG